MSGPPMPGVIMEPVTPPRVYYFGCGLRAGHWWYAPQKEGRMWQPNSAVADAMRTVFPRIDGNYCPDGDVPGEAKLTRVRGWTVLAWWDRSVDMRGGSNSVIVADRSLDFDQMIALLAIHFPEVSKRQRVPIRFVTMALSVTESDERHPGNVFQPRDARR
jgi:hypothetical protein